MNLYSVLAITGVAVIVLVMVWRAVSGAHFKPRRLPQRTDRRPSMDRWSHGCRTNATTKVADRR